MLDEDQTYLEDAEDSEFPQPMEEASARKLIADLWRLHVAERVMLDRIYEYGKGLRGAPPVPEGASDEVKHIAKLAAKNVLGLVCDSFSQNLSVVGYHTSGAQDNDPTWQQHWQRNRMDARQAEVHRPAVRYGASYATVTLDDDGRPEIRTRSPRQLFAVYDNPTLDAWPQHALETWVSQKDAKPHRYGVLYDNSFMYPVDLGEVSADQIEDGNSSKPITVSSIGEPILHYATFDGKPVCPVIRFVNARDADDMIVGEIAPLINTQKAINAVNFDRLLVSRFGARPQWVITGWTAAKDQILKASASRILTFEDAEVKAQSLPPAALEPYNKVIEELLQHIAMVAQISPANVTGKMVNLSAEALAAAEANQQRKLTSKRESFGESWEQVLRLCAEMDGDEETAADAGAEVIWRDTEARAFGAVVDGVLKLSQAGIPIEELLTLVPGLSQQTISAIRKKLRGGSVSALVDKLLNNPPPAPPQEAPPLNEILDSINGDDVVDSGS